jgi:hypothetical protein
MSCSSCKTEKCTCETNICINPLIYFFKLALSHKNNDNTYDQLIGNALQLGLSVSNKNMCCPDCVNGIYYLGEADSLSNIIQDFSGGATNVCCVDHASSPEIWTTFQNAIGVNLPCCNTDFNIAVEEWSNTSSDTSPNYNLSDIFLKGIFESSSFNGYSGLGILFNYLQLNHPELTSEDYLEILGSIVKNGLVIQCYGCEIIIAGSNTYLRWWKNTQNKKG